MPRKQTHTQPGLLEEAPVQPAPSSTARGQAPAVDKGRLTVARLKVHGVLGVEESTIDLADITVLEGSNGSGKSSHMKALRSALGVDRTSLARLAKVGLGDAEEPAVEVLLVGEDREVQVTRKGGGSPEVRERVGGDWRVVPRPVEWLRQLLDVEAANPAAWLVADDETRAAAVLAAMPLPGYSREEALKEAGLEGFRVPAIPTGLHPLEDLEQVEQAVFNSRTEVNRQERAESDAAAQLLKGIPAEAPAPVDGEVAELAAQVQREADSVARAEEAASATHREALQAAAAAREAKVAALSSSFKGKAAEIRTAHEAKAAELRAATEKRIAELAAEVETSVDAARTEAEREIAAADAEEEQLEAAANAAHEIARAEHARAIEILAKHRGELATLRERQVAAETDRHVRETAHAGEERAKVHAARSAALTAGIEALRKYRLQLADALPVKGLRVVFDDKGRKSLHLDGVPLSQVNDGRLVELATEVSLLRNRPPTDGKPYLPLVLLDGLERLDPRARAALLREIAARGSQVVAACVGPEAMRALRGEAALGGEAA